MSTPTDYGRLFSSGSHFFLAWADNFEAFGVFYSQFISTHFGTVSPVSMFSINQPLFLQKTKHLYSNIKYLFGIGI